MGRRTLLPGDTALLLKQHGLQEMMVDLGSTDWSIVLLSLVVRFYGLQTARELHQANQCVDALR